MVISAKKEAVFSIVAKKEAVFSIVGKKRQTKGTNSESKQNSGILRYGSSVERGSLNSSSGGTTMAVSYFKASFSKTAP